MADNTPVKPELEGNIDKGFFMSESDWTCYRRNYFSCVCSFTLTPMPHNSPVYFSPKGSGEQLQVNGWAMSISAVISDNDSKSIELVQHTPKRDKGPTTNPDKIAMEPRIPPSHHPHPLNMFGEPFPGSTRNTYSDIYCNNSQKQSPVTEHTFERIQFKQATQNNGKRRAAQQYYHLVVELWANVGTSGSEDRLVRVAYRKSAKMIVRGRSPGHYQTDRRGSQSSGVAPTNLGAYPPGGDFSNNSMMNVTSTPYVPPYDTRSHTSIRQHEIPMEHPISPDDEKAIKSTPGYLYYPNPAGHGHHERMDLLQPRSEPSGAEDKMKSDYAIGSMPRQYGGTPLPMERQRCGPFEGKPSSTGYYSAILSQPAHPGPNYV